VGHKIPVTHLRKMMLRNSSVATVQAYRECYLRVVEEFALFYKRPPDQLGPEQIGSTGPSVYRQEIGRQHGRTTPFRSPFFFIKTLKRIGALRDTHPKHRFGCPTS